MLVPSSPTRRDPALDALAHRGRLREDVTHVVGLLVESFRHEPCVEDDEPFHPVVSNPAVPPRVIYLHGQLAQEHLYRARCKEREHSHCNVYCIDESPDVHRPLQTVTGKLCGILLLGKLIGTNRAAPEHLADEFANLEIHEEWRPESEPRGRNDPLYE